MIGGISSAAATNPIVALPAADRNLQPSKANTSAAAPSEDTVQLSGEAQRLLSDPKTTQSVAVPTITQLIKQAADGDINALAKLAVVG